MIFSYSRVSLQNSLSPGTKRHTKDGVQPATWLMLPHLGNKATGRDRSESHPSCLPALHLPLTIGSALTCPGIFPTPFGLPLLDHSMENRPTLLGKEELGYLQRYILNK